MMPGFWQIILVIVLVVLLFGRGKISELMGDVAKGIKSFKKGLQDDTEDSADPKVINEKAEKPAEKTDSKVSYQGVAQPAPTAGAAPEGQPAQKPAEGEVIPPASQAPDRAAS